MQESQIKEKLDSIKSNMKIFDSMLGFEFNNEGEVKQYINERQAKAIQELNG